MRTSLKRSAKAAIIAASVTLCVYLVLRVWVSVPLWFDMNVFLSRRAQPIGTTEMRLNCLSRSIQEYYNVYDVLTTNINELMGSNPKQIRFLDSDDVMRDAWNRPVSFDVDPDGQWIVIFSFGADGLPGGGNRLEDSDIVVTQFMRNAVLLRGESREEAITEDDVESGLTGQPEESLEPVMK